MQLIRKIMVENCYSGNGWDFEKTTKYILGFENYQLEAGYFEHYCDDVFVKAVVELPVSYGCPAHCKFCATSAIEAFRELKSEQMREILEYIWTEQELDDKEYVLLSVTGTGDLYFNFSNVIEFLSGLTTYKNLHVTLSSCLWNKEDLKKIEEFSERISIRNIQITCVSAQNEQMGKLIPIYLQRKSNFDEIIEYIGISAKSYYRVNYIMIRGINDSEEDFREFSNKIEVVKDKVVVRISKLNETAATERHNLYPPILEKMGQFQNILESAGINCYLFYAFKNDHMNCGQLITEDRFR